MHTETHKTTQFHHTLADIKIKPVQNNVNMDLLKKLILLALDSYLESEKVSAKKIHEITKHRHGDYYQTPGYYLKLYRVRANMTQVKLSQKTLIKQHHLSEMEHNKRPIGKKLAKVIAQILDFDYRKLL